MSTQETNTYTASVTLSTEQGELPDAAEIARLISDQMDGELDEATGLRCIGVSLGRAPAPTGAYRVLVTLDTYARCLTDDFCLTEEEARTAANLHLTQYDVRRAEVVFDAFSAAEGGA